MFSQIDEQNSIVSTMKNWSNIKLDYQYEVEDIGSPFWAFAIHDGHHVDEDLDMFMELEESERLREEDPYTAIIAELPFNRFISLTSRFQLDINRIEEDAVYLQPKQAWGLTVFREDLPPQLVPELYKRYREVYRTIDQLIQKTIDRHGFFVIYDIHSYNAKRLEPNEIVDTTRNPQINLGTAYINPKWQELIQRFVTALQEQFLDGQPVDIRKNVKFKGGYLSQYINKRFGEKGCMLSIEFRKDFMDEWTGQVYPEKLYQCKQLLLTTVKLLYDYFSYEKRG